MDSHLESLLNEIHELERVVAEKIHQSKKKLTFEIEHGHAAIAKRAYFVTLETPKATP